MRMFCWEGSAPRSIMQDKLAIPFCTGDGMPEKQAHTIYIRHCCVVVLHPIFIQCTLIQLQTSLQTAFLVVSASAPSSSTHRPSVFDTVFRSTVQKQSCRRFGLAVPKIWWRNPFRLPPYGKRKPHSTRQGHGD